MPSLFRQFKSFMKEYSVSGVAVGIVMGIAVRDYASALVDDLIMPIANAFMPDTAWTEWALTLGEVKIRAGHLLSASITFLVICFIIFVFARLAVRADRK
ncbi:MAG: MscL family protein [Candidatus Coatesbacteria bacterium]|nr:MAG: MscL family protein [Candidatus Coatesbacteria bacterium]